MGILSFSAIATTSTFVTSDLPVAISASIKTWRLAERLAII
jgi:hypothetical protein